MKNRSTLKIAGLTMLLAVLLPCQGLAFRCGTKLVSIGDTRNAVLEKCGEPESVESWTEERPRWHPGHRYYPPYRYEYDDRYDSYRWKPYTPVEIIRVEEWIYNLGPSRFLRFLRFENGRLEEIETGDYGY